MNLRRRNQTDAEALREGVHLQNQSLSTTIGHVETMLTKIDNNSVEQLMKQVALGREAWLFVSCPSLNKTID